MRRLILESDSDSNNDVDPWDQNVAWSSDDQMLVSQLPQKLDMDTNKESVPVNARPSQPRALLV